MEIIEARRLQRRIIGYALIAMVVMAILVAALCVPTVYTQMARSAEQNLMHISDLKAQQIGEVVRRSRAVASQTVSRSAIRIALEKLNRGTMPLAEYQAFSTDKLADALRIDDDLLGIRRLDRDGRVVQEVGEPVPDPVPMPCRVAPWQGIGTPGLVGTRLTLTVCAPITGSGGEIEGADILMFDVTELRTIIDDTRQIGDSAVIALGIGGALRLRTRDQALEDAAIDAALAAPPDHPVLIETGSMFAPGKVAGAAPVPGTDWTAVARVDGRELYLAVNSLMVQVITGIAAMLAVGVSGLVLVLRPLTGRILVHTSELRDQVAELRAAKLALERSNKELERFAYVASHDLQEPLRTIVSFTQLLERRHGDRLQGDAAEYMAFVTGAAQRMSNLIRDLLAYSRMVSDKPDTPVPVAAAEAVTTALANLDALVKRTGCTVAVEPLPVVLGNIGQLVSLFQNLIGNALKYAHPDRTPAVSVRAWPSDDSGLWEFAVQDNGIGIDADDLERIFVIFQRGPEARGSDGTGVGLAIAQRIVTSAGGRIWAESVPGEGSTFRFTLPVPPET